MMAPQGAGPFPVKTAPSCNNAANPCTQFKRTLQLWSQDSPTGSRYNYRDLIQIGDAGPISALACPASIDALNPANSIPAGLPVGFDGKCRTGRYTTPQTDDQVADKRLLVPTTRLLPQYLEELERGAAPQPDGGPGVLTGPGSVSQPGTVTTTSPGGTTTTSPTNPYTIVYGGNSFTWNNTTTTINNDGSTTTTTAPPEVKTCGLPGTPACKIDESGTPSYSAPSTAPIDALKNDDAAKRDAAAAGVQDPGFGWFTAPPIVACTAFAWPGGLTLDPCGPMETVRSIMAYLWALFAAWWSFGVVKRAVSGG